MLLLMFGKKPLDRLLAEHAETLTPAETLLISAQTPNELQVRKYIFLTLIA